MEDPVLDALRQVDRALARQAPYAELMDAVAACEALPGAEAFAPGIALRRFSIAVSHKRPSAEVEDALARYLPVAPTLVDRALRTLSACADYPELAARYLDPLVAELEASLPDEVVARALRSAYNLHEWLAPSRRQERRVGLPSVSCSLATATLDIQYPCAAVHWRQKRPKSRPKTR